MVNLLIEKALSFGEKTSEGRAFILIDHNYKKVQIYRKKYLISKLFWL